MDGGENVLHDEALVEQDSVLVVIAFPGHEADKDVLAEGYLAVLGARAVSDNIALVHALAERNYGALVYAGALVGAGKLYELVALYLAAVVLYRNDVGVGSDDLAVALGKHHDAGVNGALMLDAGGNDGSLSHHKRNRLALHVCAHQRTVSVVVLKERDHCGRNGDHHTGAYVNVIDTVTVDLDDLVTVTAGDTLVDKAAVLVHRLGRLSDDVVILNVCGHVIDLIGQTSGLLIDLAEGSHEEAVLIGTGVGCEVGDKSDVGAFGSLYGAETTVVAVVNVSNVERSSLSAQTAGSECGHTALMSKLGEGVCLIHELAQGAGAEELLYRSRHGTDVYKALRRDDVEILKRHALSDDTLHAGEANAELVLKQLTHSADTAVAEMVDIVLLTDAVGKAVEVVDGSENVVRNDVLGDQNVDILDDGVTQRLALVLLKQSGKDDASHLFGHTDLLGVEVNVVCKIDHAVGEYLDGLSLDVEVDLVYAGRLDELCLFSRKDLALVGDYLAGAGIGDGQSEHKARNAAAECKLLVELVAADIGYVVAAAVIEQAVEQDLGAFHGGRIAGTQLAVDLHEALVSVCGGVLVEGGGHALVLTVDLLYALVGHCADNGVGNAAQPRFGLCGVVLAHCLEEPCDGQLAVLVDADIEHVVCIRLVLKPCAVVRDDGSRIQARHAAVGGLIVIYTG